jgi:hypothetical protein
VNTWPQSEPENFLCKWDQKVCEPLCNMHWKSGQYVEKLYNLCLSRIFLLEAINKFTLIFHSASFTTRQPYYWPTLYTYKKL